METSGAFLYTLVVGIVAGVLLALLGTMGVAVPLLCIGAAFVFLIGGVWAGNKHLFLIAIALVATSLGSTRTDLFLATQASQNLSGFVGANTTVEGVVTNDPEHRATSLHAVVEVQKINNTPVQGTLLAILDRNAEVSYGDKVVLTGAIELPQPFATNTGRIFDYPGYLQVQGVSVLMQRASVMSHASTGLSLQGALFSVKHFFERSVEKLFPEPDASLLEGILLGERRGIPQTLTQAFIASGLVHVVVLSGHNITIVSEGVFRVLSFLPKAFSYSLGATCMILFALMTGAGATTVRALTMALIALLARYLHRQALALRALAVAGAVMVLWNPFELLHDPSFILSMLATFGLITLSPTIERLLNFLAKYPNVRSVAASTIAVELFVTPALMYTSGTLSFLSLPANIVALPVIPLAMLSGFIAGLVGLLHPLLGFLPMVVCDVLLKWIMFVATTVQSLPFSTALVPQFSLWLLILLYVPLTTGAIWLYSRSVSPALTS